ncbi:MAG: RNA polymerase sigma factor [Opitutales bacterium]
MAADKPQEDWASAADSELLSYVKRSHHGALTEILRRYESPLIGFLTSQTGERTTAEDIAQDTFLKLIKRPPFMLNSGSLKPWLFRVATNLANDYRRKHSRVQAVETIPDEPNADFQQLGNQQDSEYFMSQLSPEIRIVVSLRLYGDLSYKEIAQQLKIPVGTATWRMKNGLETLKSKFKSAE